MNPNFISVRTSPRAPLSVTVLYLTALLAWPAPSPAHFSVWIPQSPTARPGESVTLTYLYGHPYESELKTPEVPKKVQAYPPSGTPHRLEEEREKRPASSKDKTPPGRRFRYTLQERGDHVVTLESQSTLDEARGLIIREHAKVVVHSLSQNGWDRKVGQPLELVPCTRPYGLRPGWVFQAKLLLDGKPVEGAEVEVEKLNTSPPPEPLPEDEFITRTSRSGPGGMVTTTLDAKGWWAVMAEVRAGKEAVGGREYPVLLRSVLWVYVGEPLKAKK